jgi:hypothetical protein
MMISRGMGTTWARGAATCGGMAVSRFVGQRGAGTHVAREERRGRVVGGAAHPS